MWFVLFASKKSIPYLNTPLCTINCPSLSSNSSDILQGERIGHKAGYPRGYIYVLSFFPLQPANQRPLLTTRRRPRSAQLFIHVFPFSLVRIAIAIRGPVGGWRLPLCLRFVFVFRSLAGCGSLWDPPAPSHHGISFCCECIRIGFSVCHSSRNFQWSFNWFSINCLSICAYTPIWSYLANNNVVILACYRCCWLARRVERVASRSRPALLERGMVKGVGLCLMWLGGWEG